MLYYNKLWKTYHQPLVGKRLFRYIDFCTYMDKKKTSKVQFNDASN